MHLQGIFRAALGRFLTWPMRKNRLTAWRTAPPASSPLGTGGGVPRDTHRGAAGTVLQFLRNMAGVPSFSLTKI